MMMNYILKPVRHQSFFKKYASKKFLKVGFVLFVALSPANIALQRPVSSSATGRSSGGQKGPRWTCK